MVTVVAAGTTIPVTLTVTAGVIAAIMALTISPVKDRAADPIGVKTELHRNVFGKNQRKAQAKRADSRHVDQYMTAMDSCDLYSDGEKKYLRTCEEIRKK